MVETSTYLFSFVKNPMGGTIHVWGKCMEFMDPKLWSWLRLFFGGSVFLQTPLP